MKKIGLTLLVLTVLFVFVAAEQQQCEQKKKSYFCPLCNGTNVSSCLNECSGYSQQGMMNVYFTVGINLLSSLTFNLYIPDRKNGICFSRNLFGQNEYLNPDKHYPFLWNDM